MANLIFKYGVMSAGKSNDLIQQRFNFTQNNIPCLIIKSLVDRDSTPFVSSRTGLKAPAEIIPEITYELLKKKYSHIKVFFIEESQFRKPVEVDEIVKFADENNKLVFFYGLLTDINENMFPASKRIIEKGAKLEQLKTNCQEKCCMNIATHHLRFDKNTNKVIKDGSSVVVDNGSVIYKSVCRYHYNQLLGR